MKKKPVRPVAVTNLADQRRLAAEIAAAQKEAEWAKKAAKQAKAEHKAAKQKLKDARHAAKKLKKRVKALKLELEAAGSAAVSATVRPHRASRREPASTAGPQPAPAPVGGAPGAGVSGGPAAAEA